MTERDRGPRSEWARYAYGYSDKKPGKFFWIIHCGMIALILYNIFTVQP